MKFTTMTTKDNQITLKGSTLNPILQIFLTKLEHKVLEVKRAERIRILGEGEAENYHKNAS